MAKRLDVKRLSPEERLELIEELWDSLSEEDVKPTPAHLEELERRRARLEREGPQGRPWRDVLGDIEKRGA
jgi:putative addiction module component (TIGR02574 family)